MNWYVSKLVFQVFCGDGNHTAQFDEQCRLVYAEDELHAFHKARRLGEGDQLEQSLPNAANVQWKFIDVTELVPLRLATEGAEIYSVIKEHTEAALYIRNVHRSAKQLLQQSLHQFTDQNLSVGH